MIMEFTNENFETEVLKSDIPVLVDFFAIWCGPCQMLNPIIENLAEKYEGKCKIGKVNVDENRDLVEKYGIQGIPALKIFKNGEIVGEIIGGNNEDMISDKLEMFL